MRLILLLALCLPASAIQTPAVIQSKICSFVFQVGAPGTCTFTSPTTSGSQVVVAISQAGQAWLGAFSDSAGNVYNLEKSQAGTVGTRTARIYRAPALIGNAGTLSFTSLSSGTTYFGVTIFEISGLSPLAQDSSSSGSGATSPFSCGTTTTTVAGDLLVSAFMFNAAASITPPTGFATTAPGYREDETGAVGEPGGFSTFPLTGTVSTAYTWTTGSNEDGACVVVALQPAIGGVKHRVRQ